MPDAVGQSGTPAASFLQATWPLSTNALVKDSVADSNMFDPFRLSKFYEALYGLILV